MNVDSPASLSNLVIMSFLSWVDSIGIKSPLIAPPCLSAKSKVLSTNSLSGFPEVQFA